MTRGRGGSGRDIRGEGGKVGGGVGGHMGRVGGDGDGRGMIQFVAHLCNASQVRVHKFSLEGR